jgi:hypothetical protein
VLIDQLRFGPRCISKVKKEKPFSFFTAGFKQAFKIPDCGEKEEKESRKKTQPRDFCLSL